MRTPQVIAVAVAGAIATAGCDLGSDGAPTRTVASTSTRGDAVDETAGTLARGALVSVRRALARDAECGTAACLTPVELGRRARSLSAAVRPLDEALAAGESQAARLSRTYTSAFLHAAQELRTCLQLSAEKHAGRVDLAECQAPVTQFEERAHDLRSALNAFPSSD